MTIKLMVMGVSGSGKSTLGLALAQSLNCRYIEADELHSKQNRAKMTAGIPLDDDDRWPWLAAIAQALEDLVDEDAVFSCSALKSDYRNFLRSKIPNLQTIFMQGSFDEIQARLSERTGHFMPAYLLESQFKSLETPTGEPSTLALSVGLSTQQQIEQTLYALGRGNTDL